MAAGDVNISPEFEATTDSLRDWLDNNTDKDTATSNHGERRSREECTSRVDSQYQIASYASLWVPTTTLPRPSPTLEPNGHLEVQEDWERHFLQGSDLRARYMRNLAMETNHLEGVFKMKSQVELWPGRVLKCPLTLP